MCVCVNGEHIHGHFSSEICYIGMVVGFHACYDYFEFLIILMVYIRRLRSICRMQKSKLQLPLHPFSSCYPLFIHRFFLLFIHSLFFLLLFCAQKNPCQMCVIKPNILLSSALLPEIFASNIHVENSNLSN